MGSFRSEDMTLCSLYLQAETAYFSIAELGELSVVHFRDLNKDVQAFQRKFIGEIRRCEEMERQLRVFEKELRAAKMEITVPISDPDVPAPRELVDLEAMFERLESELKQFTESLKALEDNQSELQELQHVLAKTEIFFMEAGSVELPSVNAEAIPLSNELHTNVHTNEHTNISYVAGTINQEKLTGFMRMLWFTCRGNVLVRHVPIDEHTQTDPAYRKVVFVIFFQGEHLKLKVKKICDGFRAKLYPCPESLTDRREMSRGLAARLIDLRTVIMRSSDQRQTVLLTLAGNLHGWLVKVKKVKAIYYVMNMMTREGQNFVGECWVPVADMGTVQMVLNKASEDSGLTAPSLLHPVVTDEPLPTFYRTNKFTAAFQNIVDAYGFATYKEVNPAFFGLISFPFLFAVMFGDFGHGVILLLFGLWMVLQERKLRAFAEREEMFGIMFGGRYMIVMMGLFSMYTGMIYNDVFSKPTAFFAGGSAWHVIYDNETLAKNPSMMLDPNDTRVYNGTPYPFGIDPAWQMSTNKITFTNSFKEKISVIFGISQMLLGVILSTFNHVHFKQKMNIIYEFIPQVLFLLAIFGYLVALIVTKWIVFPPSRSADAPSLLIGYINMFLMNYSNPKEIWYPGQETVQKCLVVVALVTALWMLTLKPLVIKLKMRRQQRSNGYTRLDETPQPHVHTGPEDHQSTSATTTLLVNTTRQQSHVKSSSHSHEEEFSEVCIHQAIHTIEFCLGCVSHTASYLRLWALSLAHAQLSEVLWGMVLSKGFAPDNPFIGGPFMFIAFLPFSCLTIAVLLFMEGLSAFLHTLRLHWVEFQSKFYKGEGYPFQPFSFREVLQRQD